MKSSITARFSAAASKYHRLADIQRRVAVKLMALIPRRPAPSLILEIGCGTGLLTEMLSRAFPKANIDAVDISPAMIKRARDNLAGNKRVNLIVTDAEKLAETKKYPLIASNCTLHWMDPIQAIIQKLGAMLAPDGALAFAVMIRGTLSELNSSRKRSAPHKPSRVTLPAATDLRKAINKAGLTICVKKSETIRQEFSSAEKMLKQLHDQGLTGGNNRHGGNLLTRSEISSLIADYSKNYKGKKEENSVYATYRVFYCVAIRRE